MFHPLPATPHRALLAFALAVLALCAPLHRANAGTAVPLTLEDLERIATDIFVGTVERTRAAWDQDHRVIETEVRIRIDQRVKGRGGPRTTVVVPGGIVGEIGMRRSGAATFKTGERVLLFAEPGRSARLRPVGLYQGKMRVRHDGARNIDLVEAPGPAWGARGERIPSGTIPKGRAPALPLAEILRRLGASP
jgi:hypothetical protein